MMKKILLFLIQPFPLTEKRWIPVTVISLFISFFMILYQPFGLREVVIPHKILFLAGYGLITFLVLLLDMIGLPLIIPGLLDESSWTIGKEILWILWIILTISIGNYFYSCFFLRFPWVGLKGFLVFLFFTASISLFPVAGSVILSYHLMLRRYVGSSQEINKVLQERQWKGNYGKQNITLKDHKGREILTVPVDEIRCMVSEGNYVSVFLDRREKRRMILRNTLQEMEKQVKNVPVLFRCHRAFIVNMKKIEKVKGNSQGYRLVIPGCDEEIPVSRGLSRPFRERFAALR